MLSAQHIYNQMKLDIPYIFNNFAIFLLIIAFCPICRALFLWMKSSLLLSGTNFVGKNSILEE